MKEHILTVYAGSENVLAKERVWLSDHLSAAGLDALWALRIAQCSGAALAVVSAEAEVRAVWIGRKHLPDEACRLGRIPPGSRWLTSSLQVEAWGVPTRAFVGPDLFVRQVDIDPARSWFAPFLVKLPRLKGPDGGAAVEKRKLTNETAFMWRLDGQLNVYTTPAFGSRWALYGAGNTPPERLLRLDNDLSVDDLRWSLGAVSLSTLPTSRK